MANIKRTGTMNRASAPRAAAITDKEMRKSHLWVTGRSSLHGPLLRADLTTPATQAGTILRNRVVTALRPADW